MQPENPQQQPAPNPSLDYLNQIAPTTPQKTLNPLVLWGAIAAVLVVVAVVFIALLSSSTSNGDRMTVVAARLAALQTITTDASDKLQSSELRASNGSLRIVVANANRDAASSVSALGATTNEKDKRVVAVAADTKTVQDALEDARLNGVYDRRYAREVAYYLKTLQTDMQELYQTTSNGTVQNFLSATDENLRPFIDDFANYQGD